MSRGRKGPREQVTKAKEGPWSFGEKGEGAAPGGRGEGEGEWLFPEALGLLWVGVPGDIQRRIFISFPGGRTSRSWSPLIGLRGSLVQALGPDVID